MSETIVDYNASEEEMLLDLINKANKTALTPGELSFSHPTSKGRVLTQVRAAPTRKSKLKGQIDFHYSRMDLSSFFFGIPLYLYSDDEIDESWVSEKLSERWSVFIPPEKVHLETASLGPGFPRLVTVDVTEKSLCWTGEIEIWVLQEHHVHEYLSEDQLIFLPDGVKRNGYLYSIEHGLMSENYELFDEFEVGDTIKTSTARAGQLIKILNENSQDNWAVFIDPRDFNLKGAKVVYKGDWKNTDDQMLVLELSEYCTNLYGKLFIRFKG